MSRGPQRLEAFAQALATGVTPVQAARIAGYPNGSCFAPNARKCARRNDVTAMVAELQKPAKEKLQKQIEANFEFATEKLMSIANAELDLSKSSPSDKIRAIEVLAKMHGWNAPEKREVNAPVKVERIELVFVDPPARIGGPPTRSGADL
jgi:erythromycin esterase-like protein